MCPAHHFGEGTVAAMSRQARRRTALAVLLAAGFLLGACGDDSSTASTGTTATTAPSGAEGTTSTTGQEHGCGVAEGGKVMIVAKDLAWDVPCLQAPEGNPLTITVDNRDSGVNHNLHIKGLPDGPSTELAAGPVTQTLRLPGGLKAGTYGYVCDIHPNMTGNLELLAPLEEPNE
jgi:plastocyanin